MLAGWLALLISSPFRTLSTLADYYYSELAVSPLVVTVAIASTHYAFPGMNVRDELAWVDWLNTKMGTKVVKY